MGQVNPTNPATESGDSPPNRFLDAPEDGPSSLPRLPGDDRFARRRDDGERDHLLVAQVLDGWSVERDVERLQCARQSARVPGDGTAPRSAARSRVRERTATRTLPRSVTGIRTSETGMANGPSPSLCGLFLGPTPQAYCRTSRAPATTEEAAVITAAPNTPTTSPSRANSGTRAPSVPTAPAHGAS